MRDKFYKFLAFIENHPQYASMVQLILVVISILYLATQLSSCSMIKPAVQNNEFGAEGVVSKEKNVSRTTKWYYNNPTSNDM